MAGPVRRNVAHLTTGEREAFAQALRDVDTQAYSGGVSFWGEQDQVQERSEEFSLVEVVFGG